jgi:hypothetical protein
MGGEWTKLGKTAAMIKMCGSGQIGVHRDLPYSSSKPRIETTFKIILRGYTRPLWQAMRTLGKATY